LGANEKGTSSKHKAVTKKEKKSKSSRENKSQKEHSGQEHRGDKAKKMIDGRTEGEKQT